MSRLIRSAALVAAWLLCGGSSDAQERPLDDFSDLSAWSVVATDDVKATLRAAPGPNGNAACVDFDFGRVTGYIALRRKLVIDFPVRYDIGFDIRGEMAPNALQLKFSDASGDNVWWTQRPEYRPPAQWQRLRVRQRQVEFAWGPTSDRVLRRSEWVEFVIASGSGGGRGHVCVDRLSLRELPPVPQAPQPPIASATSALAGHLPAAAVDGNPASDWQSDPGSDRVPQLTVDLREAREFGSLTLRWRSGMAPGRYAIELSDDGQTWQLARQILGARGDVQTHWLPDSEARFVRIRLLEAWKRGVALAEFELGGPDLPGASVLAPANEYFARLAKTAARGAYPRSYLGEQSYWTVFGVERGKTAALLSEDGVVEPRPGVGALEPFLIADGAVVSWADAQISHALRDGDLPMPSVRWQAGDIHLDVRAFAAGTPQASQAYARYVVRNAGARQRTVTLALAWRPFQANPPSQFLANPGGAVTISTLSWDGSTLVADGSPRLQTLTRPDDAHLERLAAGPVRDWLSERARGGAKTYVRDEAGYASGVLRYRLELEPGQQRAVDIALPMSGAPVLPDAPALDRLEAEVAQTWRKRLGDVRISGNAEVQDIALTLRAALAQILVNRSGPALQPGARAYARSWIRDGAMTSSALLRLGRDDVARDFLRWYAPFQFGNGKVPCCATERGADPVPENDSDGELIYAAADLWHHTHDAELARSMWPHVRKAVEHMEALRQSQRTEANRGAERAGYFGMMPPSISHEGYSDKAAYSYWDNFWAWIGYRSAVELAQALGLSAEAARIATQRDEFQRDLINSVDATAKRWKLDVLAGAADRGDVDPTSSTIALAPGGLLGTLPDTIVRNTFDRYWRDFEKRRADEAAGIRHGDGAYTPYEWRNVGSFVRLGQRERALAALNYFYRDRRPAGWRQWAEVVVRNEREPRFLGDMPHGWVASDHIRSVLDLFVYEHEGERSVVLAAGVPLGWLQGEGLAIDGLRTPYGQLSWRARAAGTVIEFDVQALREMPPGGLLLRGPWSAGSRVSIDGQAVAGPADSVRLPRTPARVRIETAP